MYPYSIPNVLLFLLSFLATMPGKQTFFLDEWLVDDKFKTWIAKGPTTTQYKCVLCSRVGYLSNMGRTALTSHMDSKKHREKEAARNGTFDMAVYTKTLKSSDSNVTSKYVLWEFSLLPLLHSLDRIADESLKSSQVEKRA